MNSLTWESPLTMRPHLIIRYLYPIIDARASVWKTHIVLALARMVGSRQIEKQFRIVNMAKKAKRSTSKESSPLPGPYQQFIQKYPDLGEAHEQIASVVEQVASLDGKTCALIKIGICVGAGLESALRSHVRRAVKHGATRDEIEQAILLGMNTVGFPRTVAAWTWANKQYERGIE
jgi:4-carboxymuconolactone decarboxylase